MTEIVFHWSGYVCVIVIVFKNWPGMQSFSLCRL